MELMEVVLLCMGAAIFFASFFIPDRKSGQADRDTLTKEQIQDIFDEEYEDARQRILQLTDETIEYSMEKAERSLERALNEKMMAFGEYSDAVMEQIGNNHQETVFMYDMLNNSKQDLTNLLLQTDKSAQDAYQLSQDALTAGENAKEIAEEANKVAKVARARAKKAQEQSVVAEEKMLLARKNAQGESPAVGPVVEQQTGIDRIKMAAEKSEPLPVKATVPVERRRTNKAQTKKSAPKSQANLLAEEMLLDGKDVNLKFTPDEESSVNSNERILELHKRGKSNVAIAKALGLGVGEVKLVIDLFETK
ncbi:MAG: hypothetical protein K2K96_05930 [Lachnospiraceae bacterium]|nr:hypothetical protein [Lachnospiraceae bacterium]